MSAGAVFQHALRIVIGESLPPPCQHDVVAALEAGRPGPLEFLYEAGAEARLPAATIMTRSAAIYFMFCAANLSDDLSDGDCAYLSDSAQSGPCVLVLLQSLFLRALADAKLPNRTISVIARDLSAAAGAQHVELRTRKWTAPIFARVAEGIAGGQWSAYLRILWFGSPLADRAPTVGMRAGLVAHVAEDIRSRDRRYTTLSVRDKSKVLELAMTAARALRREHLRCIDAMLAGVEPILDRAMRAPTYLPGRV